MYFCFNFCSRSNLLQEEGLGKLQDIVFQQTSGKLPSVIADDISELPAVIKMGWLDKNQPTGYEIGIKAREFPFRMLDCIQM